MKSIGNVGRDEMLTQFQVQYVEDKIVEAMGELMVGRKLFAPRTIDVGKKVYTYYNEVDMSPAVISMGGNTQAGDVTMYDDNDVRVPAISKDFFIQWRDIQASKESPRLLDRYALNAAKQVAEEEDKLMITGEYTGWGAYNIEGLATKTGRLPVVGGAWPTNVQANINTGRAALEAAGFYNEPILVATPTVAKYLDTFVGTTAITYRQAFLQENGILSGIMETTSLFTAAGLQTNALLVVPDPAYLYYVEGQPPLTTWWYDKDGNAHGKVREVITPVIAHAGCIAEITGITAG